MPGYRGHLAGGLFAYVCALIIGKLFCITPSATQMIEWLCFTLAGALFPDVDTKSRGQQLFYWLWMALLSFLCIQKRYMVAALFGIVGLIPTLAKHRGIFHKLWFITGIAWVIIFYVWCTAPTMVGSLARNMTFFVIGAFSHVLLDKGIGKKRRYS